MNFLDEVDYTRSEAGDLYDELSLWSAPFGLLMLERMPMARGATIVDVGAGTGFLAIELAQRCGPDSRVYAVDPWTAGVSRLLRKIDYLRLANVEVFERDAAALPLADGSVDVIVSNLGLNNFADPLAVLRECRRVAKPGAALCLTTNLTGHMKEFYGVYRATLQEYGLDDSALDAHIAHRGTIETVSRLLASGGFPVARGETRPFTMRFADGTALLNHYFIRLGFLGGWKSACPAADLPQVWPLLERNLNAYAAAHGELALTVPMAYVEGRKPA